MAGADFDSEDETPELRVDEYGERFEDYGFLKRAEEHKQAGNADFKKDRYEKALKEYECALDQLMTVAHDKSIVIGRQKWNDVVVLRATIHLNRSTCNYKLKNWQKSADAALECLHGNIRDELMYTDPKIRAKVKAAEQKNGQTDSPLLEQKLPKATRAKAWFRLSRCHANLGHMDRAKDALAKALEMCEDKPTIAEMNQHAIRVDALEKQQKQKQKQQFKGFFDKLQERGGYVDAKTATKAKWDQLDYAEKVKRIEELDDSDSDDEPLPLSDNLAPGAYPEASFEESLDRKGGKPAPSAEEETLALGDATAGAANAPYTASDISAYRQQDTQRREREWRQRSKQQEIDELEEDELKKARERLAKRQGGRAKRGAVGDSDA